MYKVLSNFLIITFYNYILSYDNLFISEIIGEYQAGFMVGKLTLDSYKISKVPS